MSLPKGQRDRARGPGGGVEEDAVMAEMDRPMVRRRRRAAVAKLAASAMESSGFVREGERVGGRARAGEWRGSRASSTSSRLA